MNRTDIITYTNFDGVSGVIGDRLPAGEIRTLRNGLPVLVDTTGAAHKILCSELVPLHTEDGLVDGRCLLRVTDPEILACAGHASVIRSWRGQSELETRDWERAIENDRY